jgi:hypothetical protein
MKPRFCCFFLNIIGYASFSSKFKTLCFFCETSTISASKILKKRFTSDNIAKRHTNLNKKQVYHPGHSVFHLESKVQPQKKGQNAENHQVGLPSVPENWD